ncbi:MAG: anti-sigma F factor [Clostridia bacterium]|nr:anti-sigma F factor [Clostridia bacterium]MBP3422856.1 anti-sigma F factor [Clostridia bacterium]
MKNYMKLEIAAKSINEGFARSAVAAFALSLNPSLSDLSDIKTSVSEAVTNAIVHAYAGKNGEDKILIECVLESTDGYGGVLHIKITDYGCGIEDLEKALIPFYTTLADEERSGMGFTIMQTFTDDFSVKSEKGKGTTVELIKKIGAESLCAEGIASADREKDRLNA